MTRPGVLAALVSVALAACGGSGSSSSSTSSSTSSSSSPTSTSSAPAASSSTPSAPTTSTTATSSPTTTPGPDTNVRLPAKFDIRAGGTLFPPVVAAPKHTTIVLTVRARDGRHHTLVLATPQAHTFAVAPGKAAQLVLNGLPNGAYVVKVDGAIRGRLIVGAAPGP